MTKTTEKKCACGSPATGLHDSECPMFTPPATERPKCVCDPDMCLEAKCDHCADMSRCLGGAPPERPRMTEETGPTATCAICDINGRACAPSMCGLTLNIRRTSQTEMAGRMTDDALKDAWLSEHAVSQTAVYDEAVRARAAESALRADLSAAREREATAKGTAENMRLQRDDWQHRHALAHEQVASLSAEVAALKKERDDLKYDLNQMTAHRDMHESRRAASLSEANDSLQTRAEKAEALCEQMRVVLSDALKASKTCVEKLSAIEAQRDALREAVERATGCLVLGGEPGTMRQNALNILSAALATSTEKA